MIVEVKFEVENVATLREILQTGKAHSLLDYKVLSFKEIR